MSRAWIHPHFHEELNGSFYAEDPLTYFELRLASLIALRDERGAARLAMEAGVTFADITVLAPSRDDAQLEAYTSIETTSLLHLVAETYFRLFFSHEHLPTCPPLEMAALTDHREFKRRLSTLREHCDAQSSSVLDGLREVFRGGRNKSNFSDLPDDVWEGDGVHLLRLSGKLASTLLDGAGLYNTYKHGFGLQTSHPMMQIGEPDEGPGQGFRWTSPALSFLHRARNKHGEVHWIRSTTSVSTATQLALCVLAIEEIRSLWKVAGVRYTSLEDQKIQFRIPDLVPDLVRKGALDGGLLNFTWSQGFPVYTDDHIREP